jgi:hypothetical protein
MVLNNGLRFRVHGPKVLTNETEADFEVLG